MENKYYAPSIEDFCIGFEYEFKGMTTGGLTIMDFSNNTIENINEPFIEIWTEEIFQVQSSEFYRTLQDIEELINSGQIRVKYLDEQDCEEIINLLFPKSNYKSSKKYFTFDAPGSLGYWVEVIIDFRFGWDDMIIKGARGDEEEQLFCGKIKNKSELKRLLKQITE